VFLGTFNPLVYPERGRYLERIIDLADRHQLKTYIANGVYGREFGRIQAQSRIVFNHSFAGQNLNMRVFEALAAGRLLLTDRCEWARLPEIFRDREHLVYYENPQQFEELLLYYLAHPDERTRIARQGQAEVLARHTYKHRAGELVQAVGEGRATCETPDGRIERRLARLSNGAQAGKAYATSAFYMSFKNESIQRFNELIAECPADGHLWRDLGSAHGEAKQYDLAAREFRRAIRHSPNLIGAYEGLAWVLCELEDWAALEEVAEAGMRLLTAAEPLDFSPGCVFPSFLSWSKTMLTILLTESVAMAPGHVAPPDALEVMLVEEPTA
jgi:tetratricopeptide (TPR) repeat protein